MTNDETRKFALPVTEEVTTESVVYGWVPAIGEGETGQWMPQSKKVDTTKVTREFAE